MAKDCHLLTMSVAVGKYLSMMLLLIVYFFSESKICFCIIAQLENVDGWMDTHMG